MQNIGRPVIVPNSMQYNAPTLCQEKQLHKLIDFLCFTVPCIFLKIILPNTLRRFFWSVCGDSTHRKHFPTEQCFRANSQRFNKIFLTDVCLLPFSSPLYTIFSKSTLNSWCGNFELSLILECISDVLLLGVPISDCLTRKRLLRPLVLHCRREAWQRWQFSRDFNLEQSFFIPLYHSLLYTFSLMRLSRRLCLWNVVQRFYAFTRLFHFSQRQDWKGGWRCVCGGKKYHS